MPGAIGQPLEISPLAGRLGPKRMLVDMAWLELECYSCRPIWTTSPCASVGGVGPICGDRKGEIRDTSPVLIRLAWSSQAALVIAPLRDLLNPGREGR